MPLLQELVALYEIAAELPILLEVVRYDRIPE